MATIPAALVPRSPFCVPSPPPANLEARTSRCGKQTRPTGSAATQHHSCVTVARFLRDCRRIKAQVVGTMGRSAAGGGSTMPLRLHGIRAIDVDRDPGPEDWLVVAIGS